MSQPTCERAGLVEAMFDGRLGPSERASTQRHLKGCASCGELLQGLSSLRSSLRAAPSPITPLEHQRARLTLLRQAAKPAILKPKQRAAWAFALVALPVAALAAGAPFSPLRLWQPQSAAVTATAKHAPQRRTPREPALVLMSATPPVLTTPALALSASAATPRGTHRLRLGAVPAPVDSSQASRDFAAALQALSAGDFGLSASKLRGFAAAHPSDARVEDATYLEAIALERAGRTADAQAAARRYLARYPNGAHRVPALRLAGD